MEMLGGMLILRAKEEIKAIKLKEKHPLTKEGGAILFRFVIFKVC